MSEKKPISASFRAIFSARFVAKICSACMKYHISNDANGKLIFNCDHFGEVPKPYVDCQSYDCPQYEPKSTSVNYRYICQKRLEELGHE